MLKAYDFSKYKGAASMSKVNSFNLLENEIAESLVKSIHADDNGPRSRKCTVCGSEDISVFFEKWGVPYFRCASCDSIFVSVSPDALTTYASNEELIRLRTSRDYQNEETSIRSIVWEELLDWVRFRTFRYIGRKSGLSIIDYGNRYKDFAFKILNSDFCSLYELRDSILQDVPSQHLIKADIIFYFNKIQQSLDPLSDLKDAFDALNDNGLLFFSTRIGTGFDILTLKNDAKIFPFEHVLLPSVDGLKKLLSDAGFTMLEYSTPGRRDVEYVHDHKDSISPDNLFVKYMIEHGDETAFAEFQRFLQKNGFSSHAQIVAKKVNNYGQN